MAHSDTHYLLESIESIYESSVCQTAWLTDSSTATIFLEHFANIFNSHPQETNRDIDIAILWNIASIRPNPNMSSLNVRDAILALDKFKFDKSSSPYNSPDNFLYTYLSSPQGKDFLENLKEETLYTVFKDGFDEAVKSLRKANIMLDKTEALLNPKQSIESTKSEHRSDLSSELGSAINQRITLTVESNRYYIVLGNRSIELPKKPYTFKFTRSHGKGDFQDRDLFTKMKDWLVKDYNLSPEHAELLIIPILHHHRVKSIDGSHITFTFPFTIPDTLSELFSSTVEPVEGSSDWPMDTISNAPANSRRHIQASPDSPTPPVARPTTPPYSPKTIDSRQTTPDLDKLLEPVSVQYNQPFDKDSKLFPSKFTKELSPDYTKATFDSLRKEQLTKCTIIKAKLGVLKFSVEERTCNDVITFTLKKEKGFQLKITPDQNKALKFLEETKKKYESCRAIHNLSGLLIIIDRITQLRFDTELDSPIKGLSQNATDVQFIDMSGPSRRRSVSVAGMVKHDENYRDDVFCDSPIKTKPDSPQPKKRPSVNHDHKQTSPKNLPNPVSTSTKKPGSVSHDPTHPEEDSQVSIIKVLFFVFLLVSAGMGIYLVFLNQSPNSSSQFTDVDGNVFNGTLTKDGRLYNGTITLANGDVYKGSLTEDGRLYNGTITYSKSKNNYTGTFTEEGRRAEGILWFYKGGNFNGTFIHGIPSEGTLTYENGDVFEGILINGIHSEGTLTFANGDVFNGTFTEDGKLYNGTLTYYNSKKHYEGTFTKEGYRCEGMLIYENGDVFNGTFTKDGIPSEGTLTLENGIVFNGTFSETGNAIEGRYTDLDGNTFIISNGTISQK